MQAEYLDVEKKLKLHKEMLLKEFISKGIYPDNNIINSRLRNIDMHLSVFKHHNVVDGNRFNTDEYNIAIKSIYEDLAILFNILYKLTEEEYYNQRHFIGSYTSELESIVDTYKKRADFENNSTAFGKTLLFQNNEFQIKEDNSTTIIKMNNIKLAEATRIACFANVNNVHTSDLSFQFRRGDEVIMIPPYNMNNETLVIPGQKIMNTYNFELQEDQEIKGPVILEINTTPSTKNEYDVLCGKNKMLVSNTETNYYKVEETPASLGSYMTTEKSFINFYVVNGNSISFKFNKKPLATNFPLDDQKVTGLKHIQHFFIEADKDFAFEIELDKGEIYSIKEDGIVNNNKLYYAGATEIKDFYIIENIRGEEHEYEATLKIFNNNSDDYDIESLVIKEME